ncbi:hypothetical protein RKD19_000317 [Streptomyces canus]|uniref:putative quinol monooxygenase n=2 Tax=Streptomyces TaxID=1883 RepID=UPI00378ADB66
MIHAPHPPARPAPLGGTRCTRKSRGFRRRSPGPHPVEGQPGTFVIFERWESREALEGHLQAPRTQDLVPRLLELMDGSVEDGIRFLWPFRPAR